jgi:hypothetical protein
MAAIKAAEKHLRNPRFPATIVGFRVFEYSCAS